MRTLKSTVYSIETSLDCRLDVPLSFDKLAKCNEFLSKKVAGYLVIERCIASCCCNSLTLFTKLAFGDYVRRCSLRLLSARRRAFVSV